MKREIAAQTASRTFGAREDAIKHVLENVVDSGQDARYWMERALQESDARKRSGASEFPATHRGSIRKTAEKVAVASEAAAAQITQVMRKPRKHA